MKIPKNGQPHPKKLDGNELSAEVASLHRQLFGISPHFNSKEKDSLIQEATDLLEIRKTREFRIDTED